MTAPRVIILASALDSSPRSLLLDRPMTVAEVVARQNVPLGLPTIAVITDPAGNSRPVMRGEWHVRQVADGHQLAFVPVPGRGSFGSILAAIAGIALAVFAPWAAGVAAGMMGLQAGTTAFSIATSLIGAGIMIAGQFIINRLMPRPGQVAAADPVYTARASSNRAMPLEVIPELFGRLRYPPPYASRPYAEFVDNDQYLYQLHCLGVGHVDPERWEIGDTLVWTKDDGFQGSFAGGDTEIEIIQPGDDITTFPANVITAPTVDGQQVPDEPAWLGPFTVNPPGTEIDRIACDYVFPAGLIHIGKSGRGSAVERSVYAEYRKINSDGDPLGDWTALFDEDHRAATRTPQRFSRAADVPPGRYEVRFGASGEDVSDNTGSTSTLNRVLWAGLRGYVHGFETPPGVTLVATRIRATEHVAREATGQYLFTCQRLLPTWDSFLGWSEPVATRSPAWAAAAMLKSLGLADGDFDLAWLAAYADIWETRGDRFDALFDRRWVAAEALDAILRTGRAYHVRLGSIIGFVRDEPKQVRRMAFTPDTVVKGSVRRHDIWFSEDAPDHLEVTFLDGETWRERSVVAAIGAIGQDKPQQLAIFGITDHHHAWREGIFETAENAYRRSFRSFQVEREGRMLVRGDPVLLHDPVFDLAAFARLVGRDGDVLTIDRDVETDPEETYHVLLRDRRGREWGPCLVDAIDGREITLDAADRAAVADEHGALGSIIADDSKQEPTHVALLRGEERLFDGLLVEARPVGQDLWDITLVNDDQRVHAVDETEVTPASWTPPSLFAPVPDSPVVDGVHAIIQRGTLGLMLEAGWRPAAGADRYVAEISYDEDAADAPDEASWSPVHDSKATRLAVTVMPQEVTLRVAGIGRLQGPWAYVVASEVPLLQLPDETLDPLREEVLESVEEAIAFTSPASIRALRDRMLSVSAYLDEALAIVSLDKRELYRALTVTRGAITAAYEERITTEIGTVNGAIVGLAGMVETLTVDTVPALASAISSMDLRVTEAEDFVSAQGAINDALELEIDGKASLTALSSLSGIVTDNSAAILAQAAIIDDIELEIGDKADTSYVDGQIATRASLSAFSSLAGEVSDHGDLLVSQGANVAQLLAAMTGYTGVNAISTTFSGQLALIEANEEDITSIAEDLTLVETSVGRFSAGGYFRVQALSAISGASSTVGITASATAGGASSNAAMLVSAVAGGNSEIGLLANRIYAVTNTSGAGKVGLFVIDSGVVYMDEARIRNLGASNINANSVFSVNAAISGTLTVGSNITISGPNARILVTD